MENDSQEVRIAAGGSDRNRSNDHFVMTRLTDAIKLGLKRRPNIAATILFLLSTEILKVHTRVSTRNFRIISLLAPHRSLITNSI